MTNLFKVILFIVIFSFAGYAQISITSANFSYAQDFNSLSYLYGPNDWFNNSTFPGWFAFDPNSGDTTQYTATDGSEGIGLRSFGSLVSTERGLGSCSVDEYWGVSFHNSSGSTLVGLPIEFTGEQWRAVNESEQYIDFAYSLNADSLNDPVADWIVVNNLRFTSLINFLDPASRLDGNLPLNNQTFSETLNISLLDGQNIWLRWQRNNIEPKWHGLGIDDFKFNPNGLTLPVELSSLTAISIGSSVKLNWTTETEVNNYGFEVERTSPIPSPYQGEGGEAGTSTTLSVTGWEKIGFVPGNGNSNSQKDYSFIDENTSGESGFQYRLKQIDNDGQFEYSKIVEVSLFKPVDFSLKQNYPNPFNPSTIIQYHLPEDGLVRLSVYDLLGQEIRVLVNEFKEAGIHSFNFNSTLLNSGVYFYKIDSNKFTEVKKMMILK